MKIQDPAHLKVSTTLVAAARTARGCEPDDAKSTLDLLDRLKELGNHIQRSSRSDTGPVCALATKITEQLVSKADTKPQVLINWINLLLEYLCSTLGVRTEEEATALKPEPAHLPSSSLAVAHYRRSMAQGTRFGEIMVRMAYMKPEDVERALHLQLQKNCRLGEAMVELGILSRRGLEAVLHMQRQKRKPDAWTLDRGTDQAGETSRESPAA